MQGVSFFLDSYLQFCAGVKANRSHTVVMDNLQQGLLPISCVSILDSFTGAWSLVLRFAWSLLLFEHYTIFTWMQDDLPQNKTCLQRENVYIQIYDDPPK